MTSKLGPFLDLTLPEACVQWVRIAERVPKPRQEKFQPVEVLLCYGLFYILNPHSYGGSNIHSTPEAVHALSRTFKRTPGSILSKMLNLDGSRRNAGRLEPELFIRLAEQPELYAGLYYTVVRAARLSDLDESRIPDFLELEGSEFELLGQEELDSDELGRTVEEKWNEIEQMAQGFGLETEETTQLVLQKARIGQHRFARQVMGNYNHTCAFCGFSPGEALKGKRLLYASHIKPWRVCNDRERLDVRNGIAACPIHDAAFDSGLLTINGGLRIHRATELEERLKVDEKTAHLFGESALYETILLPQGSKTPLKKYLDYHKGNIFEGTT